MEISYQSPVFPFLFLACLKDKTCSSVTDLTGLDEFVLYILYSIDTSRTVKQ